MAKVTVWLLSVCGACCVVGMLLTGVDAFAIEATVAFASVTIISVLDLSGTVR